MVNNNTNLPRGKVYLVGAGPGDPGLMTVKSVDCLKQADTVVYDRLADIEISEFVRPNTELIFAGKSPEKHTLTQSEINRLLAELAGQGKVVVRLKGGDPFVLGRGGEEAEYLVSKNIEFEVVPGITSAISVPAYAGIPVTHRGMASSFAVVTGHEDPDKEYSSINWENLATGVDTLVFLMAMAHLEQITRKLIKFGRSGDTPVAVIKEGARPEQKVITGTLDNIHYLVKQHGFGPPAVVVIGKVVEMRRLIQWYDNRPLFGKRILVTRSRHQSSQLGRLLEDKGALAIELPAIQIKPLQDNTLLDKAFSELETYDWLVFTSVNSVVQFFRRLTELELDSRKLGGLRIAAIGPATASALQEFNITADYVPPEYTGESLVRHLKSYEIDGKHFLLPRARAADDEIPDGITAMGGVVDVIPLYDTLPDIRCLENIKIALVEKQIDAATFASSSTVTSLVSSLGTQAEKLLEPVDIACIGPKTTRTAIDAGLKVKVTARESTIPGLVKALEEYYDMGGC